MKLARLLTLLDFIFFLISFNFLSLVNYNDALINIELAFDKEEKHFSNKGLTGLKRTQNQDFIRRG